MSNSGAATELMEYRVLLIASDGTKIRVLQDGMRRHLPSVRIHRHLRPATELQRAIKRALGASVFIIDTLDSPQSTIQCLVARLLALEDPTASQEAVLHEFIEAELDDHERNALREILENECGSRGPFSRMNWLDDLLDWVCSTIDKPLSAVEGLVQYHANGRFSLVRILMRDHMAYWFKATSDPNFHECAVTASLATLCPDSLPHVIAVQHAWNAWLSNDGGSSIEYTPIGVHLEDATIALANMQKRTIGLSSTLFAAGVMDQRISQIRASIPELVEYLEEAMSQQTSSKAVALSRRSLCQIGYALRKTCERLQTLDLPDAIIHADLNGGNILFDGFQCRFVDWSEAYIGFPFVSFEYLVRLIPQDAPGSTRTCVKDVYRRAWQDTIDTSVIEEAFALAPLMAVASTLYGRGHWLHSSARHDVVRQRYSRSLARRMDRMVAVASDRSLYAN